MGEQNRRIVDLENARPKKTPSTRPERPAPASDDPAPERALSPEADERQTRRQAPDGAEPGEGADGESIG